ncbi:MAG: hypothetical protein JJT96_18275 [Opitutales bacterium]|nr:hypothetical protein [Opitutales bacterium]
MDLSTTPPFARISPPPQGRVFDARARRAWWGVFSAVLLLLAFVILLLSLSQRSLQRIHMMDGDASILKAIARLEANRLDPATALGDEYVDLALAASELPGILGVAVLDLQGHPLITLPDLDKSEWRSTPEALPGPNNPRHTRFRPADAPVRPTPVLQVYLYMENSGVLAQPVILLYLVDASDLKARFAALDRALVLNSVSLFALVGGILWIVFRMALRRLQGLTTSLEQRTRELEAAHADLALAAKSSALGAISAHLFHELKNPLAGLYQHLSRNGGDSAALASTASMQRLLQQTLAVLRFEKSHAQTDFTVNEIFGILQSRAAEDFPGARVERMASSPEVPIPGRVANLAILILGNLLRNALEASSSHPGHARLRQRAGEAMVFEVEDNGPGLPPDRLADPFRAGRSEKPEGTGLGLALSYQLARHIGATLTLEQSSAQGTRFALRLPTKDPP